MHLLALDVETLTPSKGISVLRDPDFVTDETRPFWNLISNADAQRQREPFPPLPEHVPCCIRWLQGFEVPPKPGSTGVPFRAKWSGGTVCNNTEEIMVLAELFKDLSVPHVQLVTFNGLGFDLPLLRLRALKLGLGMRTGGIHRFFMRFPPRDRDIPYHLDVLEFLTNYGSVRPRFSLQSAAKLMDLPDPKAGGDGGGVKMLWEKGKHTDIRNYCDGDVWTTFMLGLRILQSYGFGLSDDWESIPPPEHLLAQVEGPMPQEDGER